MLDLEPRRLYAHTRVASDTGCVAIARGPIVYCAEQADNGDGLYQIRLPRESQLRTEPVTDEVLGEIVRVAADAYTTVRHADDSPLYTEAPPVYDQPIELKLFRITPGPIAAKARCAFGFMSYDNLTGTFEWRLHVCEAAVCIQSFFRKEK